MTLPFFVDAQRLRGVQPLPRADRRRIGTSLASFGLFPANDYSDETAFYNALLELYSRGPAGLMVVNSHINAISPRAALRRRLATSFIRQLPLDLYKTIRSNSVVEALLTVARVASNDDQESVSLDALWIAWLYRAKLSHIRQIVEANPTLLDVLGDWPKEAGALSIEGLQASVPLELHSTVEPELDEAESIELDRLQVKLHRLLGALKEVRRSHHHGGEHDYESRLRDAQMHLQNIPLVHGTAIRLLSRIWQEGALRSRQALGLNELEHQRCFGTYGAVYASVGVMYPQRQVAIILSTIIEGYPKVRVDASPWDSGTFYGYAAKKLGLLADDERARVFHEHTLPSPIYRDYLVEYVATCFADSRDYLGGRINSWADPLNVMTVWPNDLLVRVFETRLSPSVALGSDEVEAVFLPSPRFLTAELRERVVPALRRARIKVEYYGSGIARSGPTNATPADLQRYVTRWMLDRAARREEPNA